MTTTHTVDATWLARNWTTHNILEGLEYHYDQATQAGEGDMAKHLLKAITHFTKVHDELCPKCNL